VFHDLQYDQDIWHTFILNIKLHIEVIVNHFLASCLLAHSLIYRVLTVTVSPRTVMGVKKVQRHRQGSV